MIKKALSISTIILVLIATVHFSVAIHYCGGMVAAAEVSFSGKPATCGMEDTNIHSDVSGLTISSHCCDNDIRFFGVRGNYFPTLTSITNHFEKHFQTFVVPDNLYIYTFASLTITISKSPPGPINYNSVELADICTYRI
jgi:hypothetical protein